MKKCSKCGEVKPVENFKKNNNNNDGLTYTCTDCIKTYQITRYRENGADRERKKQYAMVNKDMYRSINKKAREKLTDSYVVTCLVNDSNIPRGRIPPELIEMKREQIITKRLAKQINNAVKQLKENENDKPSE